MLRFISKKYILRKDTEDSDIIQHTGDAHTGTEKIYQYKNRADIMQNEKILPV